MRFPSITIIITQYWVKLTNNSVPMVQGKGAEKMKQGIHPDYHKVIFLDTTTNFKFLSGSTKTSSETMEWEDGNEYPVIRLDVSSDSHPFYTGRQKFAAADGRVERFNKSLVSNQTTINFELKMPA